MKARRYNQDDFDQIAEWGAQWGATYRPDQFPLIGFIVDGVAAYFLYQTDSSVCWLENMISKRDVSEDVKNIAIGLLVDAVLEAAEERGFLVAYATTDIVSVAKRAKESGAVVRPAQILLIKDLTFRTQ